MYQIALCDDNREFLECLKWGVEGYCRERGIGAEIHGFEDGKSLENALELGRDFHVCVLDIKLPDMCGIDLAWKIRKKSCRTVLVFLSAFEQYAKDGYGMNAFRYILKKELKQDFETVFSQIFFQLEQQKQEPVYIISNQRKYEKIVQKRIVYVYKKDKNAVFVLDDNSELTERITIYGLWEKLNNVQMSMIDRGLILHLAHVQRIDGCKIVMDNGHTLTTGKNNIIVLKKRLIEYARQLLWQDC